MVHIESRERGISQPPNALYEPSLLWIGFLNREFIDSTISILPNLRIIPQDRPSPKILTPRSFDDIFEHRIEISALQATIHRTEKMNKAYSQASENTEEITAHVRDEEMKRERFALVPDRFPIEVPGTQHSVLWIGKEDESPEAIGEFLARCFVTLGLDPKKDVVLQEKFPNDRTIGQFRHIHVLHRWRL